MNHADEIYEQRDVTNYSTPPNFELLHKCCDWQSLTTSNWAKSQVLLQKYSTR